MLLCAARSDLLDVRRSGRGLQRAITITVGPLGAESLENLRLVGADLQGTERLVARAEGNPLFLEQLAAEARELGGSWDRSSASTTIRALLESRLDAAHPTSLTCWSWRRSRASRSASTSLAALSPRARISASPSDRPSGRISRRRSSEHRSLRSRARPRDRVPTPRRRREPTSTPRSVLSSGPGRGWAVHLEQAATLCAELGRTQTWNAVPVNCWPGRGRGPSRDSTWLRRPTSSGARRDCPEVLPPDWTCAARLRDRPHGGWAGRRGREPP